MSAATVLAALRSPNRSQRLAWPITVEQWTRLNEELDRAYEHLADLYRVFPALVPSGGGSGGVPPIFATQPPYPGGGIADFWGDWTAPPTGPFFGWDAVGDLDPGVCLRTLSDGKSVDGYNSLDGVSGINFSGGGFFQSTMAPSSAITSVQWRIALTAVKMDFSSFAIIKEDASASVVIPFTGIGPSPFTGSGLFESAVYTVNPLTSAPWTYADVIAPAETPFGPPLDFRGWWQLQAVSSGVDPDDQVISIDYLDVIINGGGGGGTDPVTVTTYLAAQRTPARRGRLAWPPNPEQWHDLNEQMDDVYRTLTRVYELLPIVAGVTAPPE